MSQKREQFQKGRGRQRYKPVCWGENKRTARKRPGERGRNGRGEGGEGTTSS